MALLLGCKSTSEVRLKCCAQSKKKPEYIFFFCLNNKNKKPEYNFVKKIVWCGMAFVVLGQDHKLKVFSKKTSLEKKIESTPKDH